MKEEKSKLYDEITQIILSTKKSIESYPPISPESRLVSNKINPDSKIIFHIKYPFKKMKVVIAEEYTQFVSIVIDRNIPFKGYTKLDHDTIK